MGKIKISKEKIKELYLNGETLESIAKIAECNYSNVRVHLRRMGVSIRKPFEYRKYSVSQSFFEKVDTEKKAYMLGFLFADGYNQESKNQIRLTLQSKDAEILKKFSKLLKYSKPLSYLKGGKVVDLSINSKKLSEDLAKLGCVQAKTYILKYPKKIIPEELNRHFIRGYFDGDGCISINKYNDVQVNITGNFDFISDVQKVIVSETFTNRTKLQEYRNSCTVSWHGKNVCLKVLDYLYKDSKISLDRKNKLYKKIVSFSGNTIEKDSELLEYPKVAQTTT